MTLNQLFSAVIQNTKGGTEEFLCRILIRALKDAMQRRSSEEINWETNLSECTHFQEFWLFVIDVFLQRACELASVENDPVYGQATKIARILQALLEIETGESFPEARIIPYHQMMAEAGLVKLTPGPDGQTMVSLSEKGKRVAEEVGEEIRRAQE